VVFLLKPRITRRFIRP